MIKWISVEDMEKRGKWVTLVRDGFYKTLSTSSKEEVGIGQEVKVRYHWTTSRDFIGFAEAGWLSADPDEEMSNHQLMEELIEGAKMDGWVVCEPTDHIFKYLSEPKGGKGRKKTESVRRKALPYVHGI